MAVQSTWVAHCLVYRFSKDFWRSVVDWILSQVPCLRNAKAKENDKTWLSVSTVRCLKNLSLAIPPIFLLPTNIQIQFIFDLFQTIIL